MTTRRNIGTSMRQNTAWVVMLLSVAGTTITAEQGFAAPAAARAPAGDEPTADTASADAPPAADAPGDPENPKLAGRLSGQVTGPDGQPLAGARIFLVTYDTYIDRIITSAGSPRAVTGDEGRFQFEAPDLVGTDADGLRARRDGMIIATADGYGPDWQSIRRRGETYYLSAAERIKRNTFNLQLAKDDVPIHGRLLGPDGRPLAGARVRLSGITIPKNRDLDAHLARVSKNLGMFSSPEFQRMLSRPDVIPGLDAETQTDADGRFTFRGVGRDRFAGISVTEPSVVDTSFTVMTRDVPDAEPKSVDGADSMDGPEYRRIHGANFSRRLKRGRTIAGVVRDRDTGEPLPGMWVGHGHENNPRADLSRAHVVTDAQGRFTITGKDPASGEGRVAAASPPGGMYLSAQAVVDLAVEQTAPLAIECQRGIPFRLRLLDEQGQPLDAEVTFCDILPNGHAPDQGVYPAREPLSRAARMAAGTYAGFVIAGPGAVLVKTPGRPDYLPAFVDPKAFFAPNGADWTRQQWRWAYGTIDMISSTMGWLDQNNYAAIVLVNPPPGSGPLELKATVGTDRPRRVTLVDPEGQPVEGASTRLSSYTYSYEPPLRSASFLLRKLHPNRPRRLTFLHEERQLVGVLRARGDGGAPYSVRMEPWATVTGRLAGAGGEPRPLGEIVDGTGKAIAGWWPEGGPEKPPTVSLAVAEGHETLESHSAQADQSGRFRIDRLIPGERYVLTFFDGRGDMWISKIDNLSLNESDPPDALIENLELRPGEVRDLGDIRTKLSFEPNYARPTAEVQQATRDIRPAAWGEPVDGLCVAIMPRTPPVDEQDCFRFYIVAQNVGKENVRFGALVHNADCYYRLAMTDAAGRAAKFQRSNITRYNSEPELVRFLLKPGECAMVSDGVVQLVRLDLAGAPIESPERDFFHNAFFVAPGQYTVSAAVALGPTLDAFDPASGTRTPLSPAPGEWTGRLTTGAIAASLFGNAAE